MHACVLGDLGLEALVDGHAAALIELEPELLEAKARRERPSAHAHLQHIAQTTSK